MTKGISMLFFFRFNGRCTRMHYWTVMLFNVVLIAATRLILHGNLSNNAGAEYSSSSLLLILPVLAIVCWLSIACHIKRLHDLNKKSWWLLATVIPYVGAISLTFYLGFFKGTQGNNQHGIDPFECKCHPLV